MKLGAGYHGRDRTTAGVAEHDKQRRAEVVDAVFDRTDFVHIADVAGHANREDIADPLVEHSLDRHAGVGAGNHGSERILAAGRVVPSRLVAKRMDRRIGGISFITGLHGEQGLVGIGRTRTHVDGMPGAALGMSAVVVWSARIGEKLGFFGMFAHPLDATVFDVVDAADDLQRAGSHSLARGGARLEQVVDRLPDVRFDGGGNEVLAVHVGVSLLGRFDGRLNVVDQRRDVAVQLGAGGYCRDRPAMRVAQDKHDRCAQVIDAVLDRPDLVGVADVARNTNHKHVAHALVEHAFDRHAGIGTRDHGSKRMLPVLGRVGHPPSVGPRVDRCARGVPRVAILQELNGFIGGYSGAVLGRS